MPTDREALERLAKIVDTAIYGGETPYRGPLYLTKRVLDALLAEPDLLIQVIGPTVSPLPATTGNYGVGVTPEEQT